MNLPSCHCSKKPLEFRESRQKSQKCAQSQRSHILRLKKALIGVKKTVTLFSVFNSKNMVELDTRDLTKQS